MHNQILVGIGTGLVSSLLFISASSGTVLGLLILFFLAPLPPAIAGLGWGAAAGIISAVTGSLVIFSLGAAPAALFYGLAIGFPMAAFAYLLMLNRQAEGPDPDTALILEWYPVGQIVAYTALWAAALAAIAVLATGADLEAIRTALRDNFEKMVAEGGPLAPNFKRPLTDQEKDALINVMLTTLPGALASLWFFIATLNLWLAGQAAKISGRLSRPWPDLAGIALPTWLWLVFAATIALSFSGGLAGLIATGLAFSIMSAYMLTGLAIVHWTTRGMSTRPAILFATYMSLLLLNPFSGLLLALIAIAEPISPLKRRPFTRVPGNGPDA